MSVSACDEVTCGVFDAGTLAPRRDAPTDGRPDDGAPVEDSADVCESVSV